MRQLKGNDKGLSLIEVLVAVMILAIVATPFLHSFVTAANTNSKAKAMNNATVLAQSVMEGLKAEPLQEIARQFDYPEKGFRIVDPGRIGDGSNPAPHVSELRYDSAAAAFSTALNYENPLLTGETDKRSMVTASIYSEDSGENYEFLGQSDGIYYFDIRNAGQDNASYDVLVKLDATPYRTGGTVDAGHLFNAEDMAKLPIINPDRDAVCIQKEDYTLNAISEFQAAYPLLTEEEIRQKLNRTITVIIDKEKAGFDLYKTTVLTEYKYTFQNGSDPVREYVKESENFNRVETEQKLRSVYLYYFPLYSSSLARDEVIIQNRKEIPVDFYLFKQVGSDATLGAEDNYRMKLTFLEKTGVTESSMSTRLHSNLDRNIVSGATGLYTGFFTVTLNGNAKTLDQVVTPDLLDFGPSDRVFDIEVGVYAPGAGAAGYPADMRQAVLTGSRLD